ncbi:MAG TPA: hypothetical protein VGO48_10400 [Conexibacter sp.]|nr:hypothetical protein [Conexibacter sp.]
MKNGARGLRFARLVLLAAAILAVMSSTAGASPLWRIDSVSNSTVAAGGTMTYYVQVTNVGADPTDGSEFDLVATLPPGFTGIDATGPFTCPNVAGETTIGCSNVAMLAPSDKQTLVLRASVDPGVSGPIANATFALSGGGAENAISADPVTISPAPAGFGIDAFDALAANAAGDVEAQAGGHPYSAGTAIDFNIVDAPRGLPANIDPAIWPAEPAKDVQVDLPPGFVGDPTSVEQCSLPDLANAPANVRSQPLCVPASQIGSATVRVNGGNGNTLGPVPVFNITPPPDVPARFGFALLGSVVVFDAQLRSDGDYGLSIVARDIPEGIAVVGTSLTIWGDPADRSHDRERACSGEPGPYVGGPTCASGAPHAQFLRNPTSCTALGTGLPTTLGADSWTHPGDFRSKTFVSHDLPGYPFPTNLWGGPRGTENCDGVPFGPSITARPVEGSTAAAPVHFSVDVNVPVPEELTPIGQSDVRRTVVTLPEGVRVSPSSADGLAACNPAQIALRSDATPTCPAGSKIASVTIDTPLLDQQLEGAAYLATPFNNPFNSLVALYLVARGPGVVVKLPGQASMDPVTGQITATFDDLPQLPFSKVHVDFKSGPRAPLSVPNRCGTYTTHAEMTGWSGRTVSSDSSFTMTQNAKGKPCPPEFTPGFSAGTESNSAGSSSSFLLRLTRDDEDQDLSALTVNMPRGLTGKIANADLCTDMQAKSDACPAGAKVGDVTVGAGAGPNPFFITNGRVYLTGPYKGAPYGLSIVVPAVAGPFDLGNVIVRSALFVDKHDATVRVVSDPLPTILQGIPLDVRDVRVNVNKPDFFINPTSCAKKTISATLKSTEGATANVSDRFQAANCASLSFKPRMVMRVGGRGHTRRGQTSSFTTTLTMPSRNQANLRFVRVSLPTTINARLNTINDACTRAEFESEVSKCAHAKAGSATAVTPLLRGPLKGTVYFVKNGHPIPDLFVALRGQVDFDLIGRVTIPGGKHLATTFDAAPDVPIRSFTLRLLGGPRTASIGAAANLCSRASRHAKAEVDYIGQNGKVLQVDQALKVAGCAKHKAARRRH